MTLKQLLSETYALGFEDEEELTESFVFAANRALRCINTELGDEKTGYIEIPKDKSDILCPQMPEFDISKYISDFLFATKMPFDISLNQIKGASVIGNSLFVPADFCGTLFIRYKPIFKNLTLDDLDTDIQISKKCEHLCPILTASYIWLDDDSEKAAYYMQIYREEASKIKYNTQRNIESDYHDVTGWAK